MRSFWGIAETLLLIVGAAIVVPAEGRKPAAVQDLWALARKKAAIHRFSTLFTAQNVRDRLASEARLNEAVAWCKATGVTKVYLEVFRDGYQADKDALVRARDRFRRDGFIVQGCVTPTSVGKRSTGWGPISCYTDRPTQERLEQIFRYAASIFDVVMIDDFWFTDCECEGCEKARGDRSWSEFRSALMVRVSRERVIGPAREVNPRVKLIIKYPEWYDRFHERGYDVVGESELFDITWIGTETRDPDSTRWGKKPQYGAYWLARWSDVFSRGKLGGGWFDPLGTHAHTYVEQARQTILGQCRESMLFCYGALLRQTGPDNVAALRRELPALLDLAEFVRGEKPRGVGTYKPPNSPPGDDAYVFNFIGMLGIPMTADVRFPAAAPSLFLTGHAAADPGFEAALERVIEEGRPVLLTSNLRAQLSEKMWARLSAPTVRILELHSDQTKKSFYGVLDSVRELMDLPREKVNALRRPLLEPLGVELSAPPRVSLYLYGRRKVVVENFNDESVEVRLASRGSRGYERAIVLPPDANVRIDPSPTEARIVLPGRSLVALRVR